MTLSVTIPMRTVSEANVREHWAKKAKRAKAQRFAVHNALRHRHGKEKLSTPIVLVPITVKLTRVGQRRMDSDNLARSMKACRDGVADWLGRDDGDPSITWVYEQEIGKQYAVRVEVM